MCLANHFEAQVINMPPYAHHNYTKVLLLIYRMFQKKLESCKKSLAHSRAVRERQSMHYTKLKPLSVHSKRARSYPSIGPTSSQQAALRARTLAEETAEDIRLFELSLKAHPNIPSSSEDQALSITTDSSDKPTITLVRKEKNLLQ